VAVAAIDPDVAAVAATVLAEPGHEPRAQRPRAAHARRPGRGARGRLRAAAALPAALPDEEARIELAADTPAPHVEASFRFYSDGEFDDSPVLDSVQRITGRPPRRLEQWARAHAGAFA
jgi:hypothetical protein